MWSGIVLVKDLCDLRDHMVWSKAHIIIYQIKPTEFTYMLSHCESQKFDLNVGRMNMCYQKDMIPGVCSWYHVSSDPQNMARALDSSFRIPSLTAQRLPLSGGMTSLASATASSRGDARCLEPMVTGFWIKTIFVGTYYYGLGVSSIQLPWAWLRFAIECHQNFSDPTRIIRVAPNFGS